MARFNLNYNSPTKSGRNKESQNSCIFSDFTIDQIEAMQVVSKNDPSSKETFQGTSTHTEFPSKRTIKSIDQGKVEGDDGRVSSDRINIWSTMTKRGYMWTSQNREDEWFKDDTAGSHLPGKCEPFKVFIHGCYYETIYNLKVVRKHPRIIVHTFLVWAVLLTAGLLIFEEVCERRREQARHNSSWEAIESAHWLSSELTEALIPLRSLQQAIVYSNYFKNLPHVIKNYGEDGSAPAIFGPRSTTVKDYRNVTGICDKSEMKEAFHKIVEDINRNFDEKGSTFSYRLAPYGVFCLVDPLVNADGFSSDVYNSTPIIGWDVQYSQSDAWNSIFNETFDDGNTISVHGPINDFIEDGVETFCAHLAVNMPGYELKTKDGEVLSSWGFVMQLMNWTNVKEKSGIYEHFKRKELSFHLTRKDRTYDDAKGIYIQQNITIAKYDAIQSETDAHMGDKQHTHILDDHNSVAIKIITPYGEWTNRVIINCNLIIPFLYGRIVVVLVTFIMAVLFALMLLERQLYKNLLFRIMPKDAVDKLNRNQTVVEHYNIATVFFADIVGYTSLVSEMKPLQVMKMLNELYSKFDKIAKKHDVYKVESIGGAYMVVAGAPNRIPAPQAAEKVALFALEIVELVKNFETSDGDRIFIRAGIASGPAVAGVVGKATPHYCFFGDTVNVASRMESTSRAMMIQCTDFTARLLQDSPKFSFGIEKRLDDVKDEGIAPAHYWLKTVEGVRIDSLQSMYVGGDAELEASSCVEPVIQSMALSKQDWSEIGQSNSPLVAATTNVKVMVNRISSILEHLLEMAIEERGSRTEFSLKAKNELHSYVSKIACMYNEVHYHNFEHAAHVAISMHKLLHSIIESCHESGRNEIIRSNFSDGISKNNFARFCLVYACLIHDVEHTGQSNRILATKKHAVAEQFPGSSAERNSIKVALDLLFQPKFDHLRKAILPSVKERFEFGRIIFWSLLCTDIAMPERLADIKTRYNVAMTIYERNQNVSDEGEKVVPATYNPSICPLKNYLDEVMECLRLTQKQIDDNPSEIQITQMKLQKCVTSEHLMQVADVSHIMQGWANFCKFNYRLYKELMTCYEQGSMPNPSDNWGNGQIGFFTNYVIPLAERTETISGHTISKCSLLANAREQLRKWEKHGDVITSIFISGYANGEPETSILAQCVSVIENET